MFHLFLLSLLTTTIIAAPIYQPAFHGPLPGLEHEFQVHHVRHVDEQGKVTYIHDTSDHRPDFCSIPGEEELCRQQIEAANNAPAVFDDGHETITLTEQHRDDELAPGHNSLTHQTNPLDVTPSSDIHSSDTTVTLENGNVITIHNENGHIRNINDDGIGIDGPAPEGGHIPNIRLEGPQTRKEKIQDEQVPDLIDVPHHRNVNDNPQQQDGPAPEGGHIPNINKGQAVTEKIASHPINKLQEAIRQTQQ